MLHRGNGREEVFHKPAADAAFVDRIAEANERITGDSAREASLRPLGSPKKL